LEQQDVAKLLGMRLELWTVGKLWLPQKVAVVPLQYQQTSIDLKFLLEEAFAAFPAHQPQDHLAVVLRHAAASADVHIQGVVSLPLVVYVLPQVVVVRVPELVQLAFVASSQKTCCCLKPKVAVVRRTSPSNQLSSLSHSSLLLVLEWVLVVREHMAGTSVLVVAVVEPLGMVVVVVLALEMVVPVVLLPAVGLRVAVWAVARDAQRAVISVARDFCSLFSQLDDRPYDGPRDLFDVFD
jgi:hypothetical protein